jgi:outer membrane lipoprotein SlyB
MRYHKLHDTFIRYGDDYSQKEENVVRQPTLIFIVIFSMLLGTGCASRLTGESFSRDEARTPQKVELGTVEHVRDVIIEGTKSQIGAGAGTIVGVIAGSTVGEGKGSRIASVLGGVVGGMAGAAAEEGLTRVQGVEVTVRLESGKTIAVVQQAVPEETFAVGDKVRVTTVHGNTRVAH